RERADRTPLVEPLLPAERVLGHRAERGLAPHLGDADGADGYAVDRDVPLVAGRQVVHVEGGRNLLLALALYRALEGARERARSLGRLVLGLRCTQAGRERTCARGRGP